LGRLGVGTSNPLNALDVEGGAAVGAAYSGANVAPGNGLIVQGNVGIGTPFPGSKLEVIGNAAVVGNVFVQGQIGIQTTPSFPLDIHGQMRLRQLGSYDPTPGMWLSGYYHREFDAAFIGLKDPTVVGVATGGVTPTWPLMLSLDKGNLTITGNGFKPGGGSWGTTSDQRLKQNVRPLDGALDKLAQLKPVMFEWKEPEQQGNLTGEQMGFLAQDVEAVFPEWVSVDPQGYKALTIRGFEALAVEAMKRLRAENDELKTSHDALLARIEVLEKKGKG